MIKKKKYSKKTISKITLPKQKEREKIKNFLYNNNLFKISQKKIKFIKKNKFLKDDNNLKKSNHYSIKTLKLKNYSIRRESANFRKSRNLSNFQKTSYPILKKLKLKISQKKKKENFKLEIIQNFERTATKKFSTKKSKNEKIFTFSNLSKKDSILKKYTNLFENEKKRKNVLSSFLNFYDNTENKKKSLKKKNFRKKKKNLKNNSVNANINCLGKYFSPIEQFYRSKMIF